MTDDQQFEARMSRLEDDVADMRRDVTEVLDLMRASKMGWGFMKTMIYIGVAVAGAVATIKGMR